jgi:hypothetical protein
MTQSNQISDKFYTFLGETRQRPKFILQNLEDLVYHDLYWPGGIGELPEFWAFGRRIWVFNKAMVWHRDTETGSILCYCPVNELKLTGENQVSEWHSGPANTLEQNGEFTRFVKRSGLQRDCAILPAFQFHLGQHPKVRIEVSDATAQWQFGIYIKGRSGAPFLSSEWHNGAATIGFDLETELRKLGYSYNYPELHFAIGTWSEDETMQNEISFRVWMPTHPAIITSLPVIKTIQNAEKEGVPIHALVVDDKGNPVEPSGTRISVRVNGREPELNPVDRTWKTSVFDLPVGNHPAEYISKGKTELRAYNHIRVTDGVFYQYDKESKWVKKNNKLMGPLSGSYQGTFYFCDAGMASEKMVQGQKEWDSWDRNDTPGERMHFWESLTEKELDERFAYLAGKGFDMVHLHQHWGIWERLDAGGRIAPHGAEQLALYMRMADKNGLVHIQALASGPYGHPDESSDYGGTIPYSRYLDEGFKKINWFEPGSHFDDLLHQYLEDFASLFSDETALFGMTSAAEGDRASGLERVNNTMACVRKIDQNHIFLGEPIEILNKMPQNICKGWPHDLLGGRTYRCAEVGFPETDLAIEFKMYNIAGVFMAEASWAPMPLYNKFNYEFINPVCEKMRANGSRICWTGTSLYRIRLRDTLYLGFVHRMPIMNTWDEQIAEDEHFILRQVRNEIDWSQKFLVPPVAVLVNDSCADNFNTARENLNKYEKAFAELPLMYRMYSKDGEPENAMVKIDGTAEFSAMKFQSDGGILPDALKTQMPLKLSQGYSAAYLWSEDRRTFIAYLYNTMNHISETLFLGGKTHRSPSPASLEVQFRNFPESKLNFRVYDLNNKILFRESRQTIAPAWDLGYTEKDYLVVVTPG